MFLGDLPANRARRHERRAPKDRSRFAVPARTGAFETTLRFERLRSVPCRWGPQCARPGRHRVFGDVSRIRTDCKSETNNRRSDQREVDGPLAVAKHLPACAESPRTPRLNGRDTHPCPASGSNDTRAPHL